MLKRLRRGLALICTLITSAVLTVMAAAALWITEARMEKAAQAAFQSNINAIVYKLQSDRSVSASWLAQTETGGGLVIAIEDRGQPLLFRGVWMPETDRASLIAAARETALREYGVNCGAPPVSRLSTTQALFPLYGARGERYLAAAVLIPSQGGWQSLILLRDMRGEDAAVLRQRAAFAGLALLCSLLLFGFSWWFSGRAIRPIEANMRRQVEFVAAASHELRSPLAVVRASLGAMRAAPFEADRFMAGIESECVRMGRLVDDLLLLAGSDAGTWNVRLTPLEPDTLLIELYEAYRPLAAQRGRGLAIDLPEESLPRVLADAERLRQALGVLVDNALQYTEAGGEITIRAYAAGRGLRIEVEDNGPGVAPEDAAHIFERFYRADKSRADKSHFGLGLSVAWELIRLHHGRLSLRQAEPHGCVFAVDLPRAQS